MSYSYTGEFIETFREAFMHHDNTELHAAEAKVKASPAIDAGVLIKAMNDVQSNLGKMGSIPGYIDGYRNAMNDLVELLAERVNDTPQHVVVKDGVYQHGAWGPYASLQEACDNARRLASEDLDDYHQWVVYSISPETGLGESLGHTSKEGDSTLPL